VGRAQQQAAEVATNQQKPGHTILSNSLNQQTQPTIVAAP